MDLGRRGFCRGVVRVAREVVVLCCKLVHNRGRVVVVGLVSGSQNRRFGALDTDCGRGILLVTS